jgi:peptidoglycan hydrolase CwlO-like protein
MNIPTEAIVALLTAITSIIGSGLYHSRKGRTDRESEFKTLLDENSKFRTEIRKDLDSARHRITQLESDLDVAKKTIEKMDNELEIAKATIIKLETELIHKNALIDALLNKKL